MYFIVAALEGIRHTKETWFENWTSGLRQGEQISKDKLVSSQLSR